MGYVIDVRYWHLADMPSCTAHVRFWGKSGHCPGLVPTWLLTQVDLGSLPSVTVCKPISILLHFYEEP